jgi:NAD(P)-dependent dehydrogenase (short-subunit alcohol dehydrogenase family)
MDEGSAAGSGATRCVIVTGAAKGLGLAIAQRFASSSAKVLLVDRDPAVTSLPGAGILGQLNTFALVKDIADPDAADVVMRAALEALGTVDTLINNAAWSYHEPILDVCISDFDRLIAINQRTPFFLAQQFFKYISGLSRKPKDPCIVNIASVNALAGNPNLAAYAGTKGALVAMGRAMAVEMAPLGIRVNCISPGAVDTPATRRVVAEGILDMNAMLDNFLIKRLTMPEEIAELVFYLCSEAAACVTGANWIIDGGYTAR